MDSHWSTPIALNIPGLHVLESSVTHDEEITYSLVELDDGQRHLAVEAPVQSTHLADFDGKPQIIHNRALLLGPLNAKNAVALRNRLAWLRPSVQGLRTGIGLVWQRRVTYVPCSDSAQLPYSILHYYVPFISVLLSITR